MWKRTLHMHPFYHRLYLVNRQLFKFADHGMARLPAQDRDIHGLLRRTAPHLHFTPQEDQRGRAAMTQLGLPEDARFVCFHSRDNGYSALEVSPEQVRMYGCRNSRIETYLPAADMLAQKGYYALRLGVSTAQTFTPSHPNIIDYTMKGRSDFMDIYLLAQCAFYLGDTCGLAEVPKIFRRPIVWVNMTTLEYAPTWSEQDIFIPQKCWLRAEDRLLTFREVIERRISRYEHCTDFDDAGVDLIPNTAEEILALALEMDARLNGTWVAAEEDEALQKQFWSFWQPSDVNSEFKCRVGTQFLRDHQDLLA
jgi:putative glycosyltransferase (TIGR04372 family)